MEEKDDLETLQEQQNAIDNQIFHLAQSVNTGESNTKSIGSNSNREEDRWDKFLNSIDKDVDDALVIYKGNEREGYGIYAQLPTNSESKFNGRRMRPRRSEVEKWIYAFEEINENKQPSQLQFNCSFDGKGKETNTFHLVEYGKNFIRTHFFDMNNNEHNSLFFSQTKSYIFVGYCSISDKDKSKNKVNAACQTFCAIEKLANFVRDCELYNKMESINTSKS